jgi:hypothetical protein
MEAIKIIIGVINLKILLCFSCVCQVRDFSYKMTANEKYKFVERGSITYVPVLSYLPQNVTKDGSVDYTNYIQTAIDENLNLIFPEFPLMINDKGLVLKSGSRIYFTELSSLVMKPSGREKFSFFYLNGVEDVRIYNPRLIGDRKHHLTSKGEWGMGISIYGSCDIILQNIDIKDTWGDGVYINSLKGKQSSRVLITDGQIDNSRRNGISLVSGRDIKIENVLISNTNGTRPSAGIDIEPNHATDVISGVIIKNVKTYNNQNEGILLVLTRIGNPIYEKDIDVKITNHVDAYSNFAMRFGSGFRKEDKPLSGLIRIENSRWLDYRSDNVINIAGNLANLPKVEFINIFVKKGRLIEFSKVLKSIRNRNIQFVNVK